jgi:hypothetical protein
MKIYRFNPGTGVYLGEDFADESLMQRETCVVPLDATTIAPPPAANGQIPFFDDRLQCWELRTRPAPAGKRLRGKLDNYPCQPETEL